MFLVCNLQLYCWRVVKYSGALGILVFVCALCLLCSLFSVSLDGLLLIAPCVFCAHCFQFLWMVHYWFLLVSSVLIVFRFSGWSIIDCSLCLLCSLFSVSLDGSLLIAPCVLSAHCFQFFWMVYYWLLLVSSVFIVFSFSGWSIIDCSLCLLCSLFSVHYW
jgi:hypothetical protein